MTAGKKTFQNHNTSLLHGEKDISVFLLQTLKFCFNLFLSRMSDSASASTKAGASRVTGPTSFSKEMFKQEKQGAKQDQAAEMRMQMMHLMSKRKELEHNISNCPNEALKNRFRSELAGVLRLDVVERQV